MPEDKNTVNFQIQYFSESRKDEFKEMCRKNDMSMKDMLYFVIENKDEIQKLIDQEKSLK